MDHFQNPRNAGELADADGIGEAGDPACGAVFRLALRFEGGKIGSAHFMASGSSAAIAAGSILTELVTGATWRQAAALPAKVLADALGRQAALKELPSHQAVPAAQFAIEALHAALEDSLRRGRFPGERAIDPDAVLVAMSGGVDSTVACLLMHQADRPVIGVTMRLWSDPVCTGESSCCSPQAIREARAACHGMGIPHLTVDYIRSFETLVVDNFVAEYLAGRTPNPCTRCNGHFRFPELVKLADMLGAAKVATGHYARLVRQEGNLSLARGRDPCKDQSYMLWALEQPLLERVEFPLGSFTKDEVRRMAQDAGLVAAARPESQDVCFIPDNDYRRFLRDRSKRLPGSGNIVDGSGKVLGSHSGYLDYTIGQRRGLGLSAAEPLYVIGTVPGQNIVIAGTREELAVTWISLGSCIYHATPVIGSTCLAQVRYNSLPSPALVTGREGDRLTLQLEEPAYGVAAGQSAVLYDEGGTVLAGGIIEKNPV